MTQTNKIQFAVPDTPLKVGIVGTGYAAKKRAEAIAAEARANLVAFTGNTPEQMAAFQLLFPVSAVNSWQQLINLPELDLIFVCTINSQHAAIARAALEAGKHVVVEYPLALEPKQAEEIINLATSKKLLLHVEHMELIGGLHQAIKRRLPDIGQVVYARYATFSSQQPVKRSWKYHRQQFGFPLAAALSRVHRLTDLLGSVASVSSSLNYWDVAGTDYFRSCLCNAQLQFKQGVMADITYGKGEVFCHSQRTLELHGDRGTMIFEGEQGNLLHGKEKTPIEVVSRRGLFAKDTTLVLDRLFNNQSLYVEPDASLYALQVADAARRSAANNSIIKLI